MSARRDQEPDALSIKYLTVAEMAGLLRVSPTTIRRLISNGQLQAIRVGRGRCTRIPESAARAYLATHVVIRNATDRLADLEARLRRAGQDARTMPVRGMPPVP